MLENALKLGFLLRASAVVVLCASYASAFKFVEIDLNRDEYEPIVGGN